MKHIVKSFISIIIISVMITGTFAINSNAVGNGESELFGSGTIDIGSDNGGTVNPQWQINPNDDGIDGGNDYETDYHRDIIHYAVTHTTDQSAESFENLMINVCNRCDTEWLNTKPDGTILLHGGENYVHSFIYLWVFARKICGYSASIPINTRLDYAHSAAKAAVPNDIFEVTHNDDGSVTRSDMSQLAFIARKLIKEKHLPSAGTNESERQKCKYLTLGLMLHLVGDMYSHKIVVPMSTVSYLEQEIQHSNEGKYFEYNDFIDYKNLNRLVERIKMKSEYYAQNNNPDKAICFTDIKYFYKKLDTDPAITDNALKKLNHKYVDNSNFCSVRFSEAKNSSKKLLDYFYNYNNLSNILEPETNGYYFKNYRNYNTDYILS